MKLRILNLELTEYRRAYEVQREILRKRQSGECPDTLLLLEHPPTITIGRRGSRANIRVDDKILHREGISVYETDRGGDVTYHGPGQLVAYPIFDLRPKKDIRKFIRDLEEVAIGLLSDFGIQGYRAEGITGVWAGGGKIASVGLSISKWVSFHGLSLNVDPIQRHLSFIRPCGLDGQRFTSLREVSSSAPMMSEVKRKIVEKFRMQFSLHGNDVQGSPGCEGGQGCQGIKNPLDTPDTLDPLDTLVDEGANT